MGAGDILLLHTDGLVEHRAVSGAYYPQRLEQKLREVKHRTAAGIYDAVIADLLTFGRPADVTLVVIKRT